MEEQEIKEPRELFQAVDMALAMSLLFDFIENPLVAEKSEVRKAAILSFRCLKTVEYVLPVISVARICFWAQLVSTAVHLDSVIRAVMTLPRFQAGTKFYLSLLFAQLDHIVDNLNANQTS